MSFDGSYALAPIDAGVTRLAEMLNIITNGIVAVRGDGQSYHVVTPYGHHFYIDMDCEVAFCHCGAKTCDHWWIPDLLEGRVTRRRPRRPFSWSTLPEGPVL